MKRQPSLLVIIIPIVLIIGVVAFIEASASRYHGEFSVDLNASNVYATQGFDVRQAGKMPVAGEDGVVEVAAESGGSLAIRDLFPDAGAHRPFDPLPADDRSFTYKIPFTITPDLAASLNAAPQTTPALHLAAIGDGWEVYVNGELVRSELFLDDAGQVVKHRAWRGLDVPFQGSLLVEGENLVTVHVVGSPSNAGCGLFYSAPYYIGDYQQMANSPSVYMLVVFIAIFAFIGFYHLLVYYIRRKDTYNLYYGCFSILLAAYLFLRSSFAGLLIPDSGIAQRLEYSSIYILVFLIIGFLESLNFRKLRLVTRLYAIVAVVFALAQWFCSLEFGVDVLRVWQVVAMLMTLYMIVFDVIIAFGKQVSGLHREDLAARRRRSYAGCLFAQLSASPLGNILIVVILSGAIFAIDLVDSLFVHNGSALTTYGFLLFTVCITFVLAKNYAGVQAEISVSNKRLEQLVEMKTRELTEQMEVAQAASRAKSEFMATMSHEIRTPMNAIICLSSIEMERDLPPSTIANIRKINSSGISLLGLINEILDISKIEAGSFDIVCEQYSLVELVGQAVQMNAVRIGEKPLSLELELNPALPRMLFGDAGRISQILNNLLSNAIKYTDAGFARLDVAFEATGEGEVTLVLKVSDSGQGIREEDISKLFVEFSQLDTRANRAVEGTGLGLAITKRLLELMGGSIRVESTYGEGSCFTAFIPQRVCDFTPVGDEVSRSLKAMDFSCITATQANEFKRSSLPPDTRILVVDDVPMNLDVAKGILEPYGVKVDCARRGQMAVDMVARGKAHYDLVLMDHMMPEMDGVEATRRIRELGGEYAERLPIIALTANALAGAEDMFLHSGFNGFVAKPIDVKALDEVLRAWIVERDVPAGL